MDAVSTWREVVSEAVTGEVGVGSVDTPQQPARVVSSPTPAPVASPPQTTHVVAPLEPVAPVSACATTPPIGTDGWGEDWHWEDEGGEEEQPLETDEIGPS